MKALIPNVESQTHIPKKQSIKAFNNKTDLSLKSIL